MRFGHAGVEFFGIPSADFRESFGTGLVRQIANRARLFTADRCEVLGHQVGVANAVNDSNSRKDCEDPKHGGHDSPAIEERAQNDKDDALGALHEAHLALADQRFCACAGIADHERGDHHESSEEYVKETVAARVEDEESEEEDDVGVAVDHGVEEGAEDGDLIGLASDAAVDHVEDAGSDYDQSGVEEHADVIVLIGEAEEDGGSGVDDQPEEGEDIRRNAGEREAVDDGLEENSTGTAEGAGP